MPNVEDNGKKVKHSCWRAIGGVAEVGIAARGTGYAGRRKHRGLAKQLEDRMPVLCIVPTFPIVLIKVFPPRFF